MLPPPEMDVETEGIKQRVATGKIAAAFGFPAQNGATLGSASMTLSSESNAILALSLAKLTNLKTKLAVLAVVLLHGMLGQKRHGVSH